MRILEHNPVDLESGGGRKIVMQGTREEYVDLIAKLAEMLAFPAHEPSKVLITDEPEIGHLIFRLEEQPSWKDPTP